MKISCIEEIAYRMNWISLGELKNLGEEMKNNSYGKYILRITNRKG